MTKRENGGPLQWSWINSNHTEGRLGRLFGNGDLILDSPDFIYGKPEHGRLIAAAADMRDALIAIRGWREIDRDTLGERLRAIEEIADAALAKAMLTQHKDSPNDR